MAKKRRPTDIRTAKVTLVDLTKPRPDKKKAKPRGFDSDSPGYWWKSDADCVHDAVFAAINAVDAYQSARILRNRRNMFLYSRKEPLATGNRLRGLQPASLQQPHQRGTYNIIRMAIETLQAKIAKARPRVTFVTDGGNWEQQQRAKGLTKYVDGQFYATGLRKLWPQAFLDACVKDAGVVHFYRTGSSIHAERVNPDEIVVDRLDGLFGAPRQMFRVKQVPREVLVERYPDFTEAIMDASSPTWGLLGAPAVHALADYVTVVEAWHLPSGKEARDGRHVLCIENACLNPEPEEQTWERPRFPFAFFRFSDGLEGFWGEGVADRLLDRQLAINKLLKAIHGILHLCSVPRYYVEETSRVVSAHMNNEIGAILKYRGTPPQLVAANAVPTELFQQLEREKAMGLEEVGVSQLSVAAQKPAGLNSGQALRDFSDIESERFIIPGQAYEEAHLASAEQFIDLSKEIAADKEHAKNFDVAYTDKGAVERVKWSDVHLDDDAYVMKMFPTSSLPQTPAARRQTIAEWQQSGWIDGVEARRLNDIPDLEDSDNDALAAYENILNARQDILDGKEFVAPEPYQDLALGLKKFQAAYLRSKRLNAPEPVLKNLMQWMNQAQDMLAKAKPPQPALPPGGPPGAPPALPPGAGGPPPGVPA